MHCSTLLHWNWTRLFERPTPMLLTWLQELFSHGQEVSKTRPHFFLFSGMGDLTRFLLLLESCQLVFFRLLRRCKLWSPDFKFSARGFWFPMYLVSFSSSFPIFSLILLHFYYHFYVTFRMILDTGRFLVARMCSFLNTSLWAHQRCSFGFSSYFLLALWRNNIRHIFTQITPFPTIPSAFPSPQRKAVVWIG